MADVVTCAQGIVDCALDTAADVCADYNGDYTTMQSKEWLLVMAFFIMAVMAFYVGANDVANAFGTSVGSKAVSIKWACILGGVANWLGAVTLGYGVSTTVQKGVSDVTVEHCWACGYCDSQMDVYAVSMFAALIGGSLFMLLATFVSMPVSTTHSIIGGVVGVTIFAVGGSCLSWKFDGGLAGIFASWVISPVLSGIIGVIIYLITHYTIMASKNPKRNAILALPILYGVCAFIILFMILLKSKPSKNMGKGWMVLISAVVMVVVAALVQFLLVPFVQKRLPSITGDEIFGAHMVDEEDGKGEHQLIQTPNDKDGKDDDKPEGYAEGRISTASIVSESEAKFLEEHSKLTMDQKDAMFVFRYLIVMVATLESYAHGANDTANSTGPVSAIYNVYDNGLDSCDSKETPVWIMAIAGCFVCIGIMIQGHRVMKTIGRRISVMDMHRGFAMEFSSTVTVVIATLLKLPVSTTHCQVGSVMFVSLVSLGWRNVSFPMLGKIVASWCITLPFAGVVAVLLTMIFRSAIRAI